MQSVNGSNAVGKQIHALIYCFLGYLDGWMDGWSRVVVVVVVVND